MRFVFKFTHTFVVRRQNPAIVSLWIGGETCFINRNHYYIVSKVCHKLFGYMFPVFNTCRRVFIFIDSFDFPEPCPEIVFNQPSYCRYGYLNRLWLTWQVFSYFFYINMSFLSYVLTDLVYLRRTYFSLLSQINASAIYDIPSYLPLA